ncbi:MAG: OB-fold domain-containing protein [Alphaproteobacteria bacterium]|nr:OB-fold domain-containing protein [Alphaproteobacteria bacterium]
MAEAFPQPVLGLYDGPMWESIRARGMRLQCCRACGAYRYPPGPACPKCLSLDYDWKPLRGTGTVISWVVFHRQYLPAYPAPYNVIAVQLDEGPIMISNLEGEPPAGSWVDARVALTYAEDGTGAVLPRFTLAA